MSPAVSLMLKFFVRVAMCIQAFQSFQHTGHLQLEGRFGILLQGSKASSHCCNDLSDRHLLETGCFNRDDLTDYCSQAFDDSVL
jgi:hypothetical protein